MSQIMIDTLDQHINTLRTTPARAFVTGDGMSRVTAAVMCARSILQDQENRIAKLERALAAAPAKDLEPA